MFLFRSRVDHHHYYHADDETKASLNFIIQKLKKMAQELDDIKADLVSANEKVTKIKADVESLHAKMDAAGDTPTAEQWAEVKSLSSQLNASLQEVDDRTEDEAAEEPTPVV